MPYIQLGQRTAAGEADTTGRNPGNYTVTFDPQLLSIPISWFEVYKIIVTGPAGSTINAIEVDFRLWDVAAIGDINSWDPNEPLVMSAGQTLYFFWSSASTATPAPEVTIWLRYDPALPGNQGMRVR